MISVKDSGQGINPEILPKLFTKFATKSETGTGLGLFISKSIVEAHRGKIWAENNADGKGFYFSLYSPSNQIGAEGATAKPRQGTSQSATEMSKRILIVEDESDVNLVLKIALEDK